MAKHLLDEDERLIPDNDLQESIKWCSSALFVGGGDTVSSHIFLYCIENISYSNVSQVVSTSLSFFLIMALHPEVQQRAHAEVDAVANGRLPSLGDYDAMPYTQALIKELLRWSPATALGTHPRPV